MSALDLSGLEEAAGTVGLRGVKARVVPPDPRRGWWFRWNGSELLVSERIVERCPPEDAPALLVATVLEERRLRPWRWCWLLVAAVVVFGVWIDPGMAALEVAVYVVLMVVGMIVWRQRIRLQADDQAATLLGDAESLVRGFNAMGKEELHFGGKRMPARPDLHKRAERLVAKHALCSAPVDGDAPARSDGSGPAGG